MTEIPRRILEEPIEGERKQLLGLATATTVLLSDAPSNPVDAVFFFGRSFFDAEKGGIFRVAATLVQQGNARQLFLADSEGERMGETTPRIANPGKSLWTDRLHRLGVTQNQILYAPHLTPREHGFNTKTEAEAFLHTAADSGYKTAAILTQPHQLVRAMLSVVKTMEQQEIDMDIWCITPQSTDWTKQVMGSQGMERKPRIEHVQDEIQRIFRYQQTGDIATFDELFTYLTRRDKQEQK